MKPHLVATVIFCVAVAGSMFLYNKYALAPTVNTPTPSEEPSSAPENTGTPEVTLETKIDQGASGLDVKVVPLAVVEDSRCPMNVTCIWAGTVKVKTLITSGLGESTMTVELGKPITTEAESVELAEVLPIPKEGVSISPADYRFIFKVSKRTIDVLH